MIGKIIFIAILAFVISVVDMSPKLKQIIYIVLGIAVLLIVLPLIGIHVPLN